MLSREDGEASQNAKVARSEILRFAQDDECCMTYPRQSSLWKLDGTRKQFYVYIMSNNSMTLYTGVTNDLRSESGFTARYHFDRLVYYETYDLIVDAISREKQIKGMTRAKKIALIKNVNPTWCDLPSS